MKITIIYNSSTDIKLLSVSHSKENICLIINNTLEFLLVFEDSSFRDRLRRLFCTGGDYTSFLVTHKQYVIKCGDMLSAVTMTPVSQKIRNISIRPLIYRCII